MEVVAAEEGATSGSTMTFGGVNYALQQFHFHLPSEHLDAGRSMAMEMHMVWEGEAGEVAVLGVFIDIDDGTAGEQPVAPVTPNTTETATVSSRASSKNKRRQLARQESQERRRKLPGVDGSFFHISAPDTAATVASTLLETVLGSVQDISEPGAVTTTQPLIMAELASVLNSGSFQT